MMAHRLSTLGDEDAVELGEPILDIPTESGIIAMKLAGA
jgi:hypothetical protein